MSVSVKKAGLDELDQLMEWRMLVLREVFPTDEDRADIRANNEEYYRKHLNDGNMPYLRDDDQHRSAFGDPPVVVNYFYHEEVKKSAKVKKQ